MKTAKTMVIVMKKSLCLTGILLSAALLAGAAEKEMEFNLLPDAEFLPMRMNGEVTGLNNWVLTDNNRLACMNDKKQPLPDGREIFKLDCKDGVFSLDFKDGKICEQYKYWKRLFRMFPVFNNLPFVPAKHYRLTGSIKLSRGKMICFGGKSFNASPEWQKLDYTFPQGALNLSLFPEPGLHFAMKDFLVTPEYPRIGGSIRLPDGGRLTSLILPKNAPYMVKRLVFCWRGWLWQLTGTALPVYERDVVRPEKGSLVFMPGKIPNNGYDLTIGKDGGMLVYGWPFAISNALENYLRKLGYIEYDHNNRTPLPTRDPRRILPAANEKCRPKFSIHIADGSFITPGIIREKDIKTGVADWYAMPLNNVPHTSNEMMPPQKERERHPECQMIYADGRRQTWKAESDPWRISPCLTDPPTRKYMLDRIPDCINASPERLIFSYALGDKPDNFCHCPRCREQNEDKTGRSYASLYFDFLCEAAGRVKKAYPDHTVAYCAYHSYSTPPVNKKIPDNMAVEFCLTGIERPCNLHLDCPLNDAGGWRKHLMAWSKLAGRERIGIATYDPHNPFMIMDVLSEVSKYSTRSMLAYTNSMIERYVMKRWNLGDDPEKIVADYNNGVFGADAGKYVTAAQRLVYEYDKKYQHKPGEFTSPGGRMRYMESLDRKTFDEVYALFDQAEKVIRARKGHLAPLLWEKFLFMATDLRKFSRTACETDADLKTFAGRVAEFIRISAVLSRATQYPYYLPNVKFTVWKMPARAYLKKFCGLDVPTTKKFWTDEPVIVEFMKDPAGQMIDRPIKTSGQWLFSAHTLRGGEPVENGRVLRRMSSGKGRIIASLKLDHDIRGTALLSLSGWDDEKPGKTTFSIVINNRKIFSGANSFPESGTLKDPFGKMYFPMPEGVLKKGENLIALINTVPDDPAKMVRALKNPSQPEDGYMLKQDYNWGWLAVDEIRLTAPDDAFLKFASGDTATAWKRVLYQPQGTVDHSDGKVTIRSAGAKYSGTLVNIPDSRWLLPQGVKFKMRIKVSGKGKLNAGIVSYPTDAHGVQTKERFSTSMPLINLTDKPEVLEKNIEHKKFGYCCPYLRLNGDGYAEITEFSLTPIAAAASPERRITRKKIGKK